MTFSIFTATIALIALLSTLASAQTFQRTINIAGRGTAVGPPDLATVITGVTTVAPIASAALDANTQRFEAVLAVLKDQGIAEKDIQTSFFDVSPNFQFLPNGSTGAITGYTVTNELQVVVRNFDSLGQVLDALIRAGSNNISGVTLSIADPEPFRNEARTSAIGDAKSKAEVFAKAAGLKVGKILSISETAITTPVPQANTFAPERAIAGSAVPISGGELEVTANVFVLYALVE